MPGHNEVRFAALIWGWRRGGHTDDRTGASIPSRNFGRLCTINPSDSMALLARAANGRIKQRGQHPDRAWFAAAPPSLVERLDLDDRCTVVAADPEGRARRRV